MLVEAKGGEAQLAPGPPRFTVTGHFSQGDDDDGDDGDKEDQE